ncbi:retrovirus-related pol polyprotein from transposon TNT 1-94 [Tanacetum coccineum]
MMRENDKEEKVKHEMEEIETINIELEHRKEVENAAQIPIATTVTPGMFKLDLDPLAPRLLQNREAHIYYLKHAQEQADILRGIVEQAKAKQPIDNALDLACKHAIRIQESLVYVRDTCPNVITLSEKKVAITPMNKVEKVWFSEPLTSSSNIKQVDSSKTFDSNTPVLSSTGLKCSTSTCRSQPTSNNKNDRILQKPSSNKKDKVEAQHRKVVHIVLWYSDFECSKHMTGNRSQLLNFVSKFLGTIRFGNDQVAKIMGYGDYYLGNVMISKLAKDGLALGIPKLKFQKDHAEAINTACYTQNRSLIRLRYNKTPYELMHYKKPDLSFLHVFGLLCYPTNDSEDLGKLNAKADIGIFVGYALAKKAFRIYNRRTQKIMETIHVTFNELTAMAFK